MKNETCSEASFELLLSAKEFASSIPKRDNLEELFATALFLIDEMPGASGAECLTALRTVANRRGLLKA